MSLRISPISLREANAYIAEMHRHHPPTRGHKFSIAVRDDQGTLRGVAVAGRPVSRMLDDGETLEVLRVATDGTPNACSMLYGAVRRAAIAMGYAPRNVLTYTLQSETGASLRASGWLCDGPAGGGSWSRASRLRSDNAPLEPKTRWRAGV